MEELLKQHTIEYNLDLPFKNFIAGQVIQSKEFNDDMKDIEEKMNEIITKYNLVVGNYYNHMNNYENPHKTTAHQVGSHTMQEVDDYIDDLKNGNLYDSAITNRALANNCIETRNIKDKSVTIPKLEEGFATKLDISQNPNIKNKYTKAETDALIYKKVGDGTYSRDEVDERFNQVQAGQIVDKSVDVKQLKDNVGRLISLSSNPSIIDRYTRVEVDALISNNIINSDFGSITESITKPGITTKGALPLADYMTCSDFVTPMTELLNIDVKEVVESRGVYFTLGDRLNKIESTLDNILLMFSEVATNG